MKDEDKAQKSGEKFRKTQALVVEILNLNPQDEDATKVFKLWKRKLDIHLQTLNANNEDNFNVSITAKYRASAHPRVTAHPQY